MEQTKQLKTEIEQLRKDLNKTIAVVEKLSKYTSALERKLNRTYHKTNSSAFKIQTVSSQLKRITRG